MGCLHCIVVTRIYPIAILQRQRDIGFAVRTTRSLKCLIDDPSGSRAASVIESWHVAELDDEEGDARPKKRSRENIGRPVHSEVYPADAYHRRNADCN